MKSKSIFLALIAAMILAACGGGKHNAPADAPTDVDTTETSDSTWDDEYVYPTPDSLTAYTDFDGIDNLSTYYDTLMSKYDFPLWYEDNKEEQFGDMKQTFVQLENYRKGKQKFYPKELVCEVLHYMAYNIKIIQNHGGGTQDMIEATRLFNEFVKAAAFYCPDVSFLASMRSDDSRAGLLEFSGDYNNSVEHPSYIMYRHGRGFNVLVLGKKDFVNVDKLFQLTDAQNRTYYLCSYDSLAGFFAQLFMLKPDGTLAEVAYTDEIHNWSGLDGDRIFFNKNTLQFTLCQVDENEVSRPIPEAATISVVLDGGNSKFVAK